MEHCIDFYISNFASILETECGQISLKYMAQCLIHSGCSVSVRMGTGMCK